MAMRLQREGLGLFLIVFWSTLGFWLPSSNEGARSSTSDRETEAELKDSEWEGVPA